MQPLPPPDLVRAPRLSRIRAPDAGARSLSQAVKSLGFAHEKSTHKVLLGYPVMQLGSYLSQLTVLAHWATITQRATVQLSGNKQKASGSAAKNIGAQF